MRHFYHLALKKKKKIYHICRCSSLVNVKITNNTIILWANNIHTCIQYTTASYFRHGQIHLYTLYNTSNNYCNLVLIIIIHIIFDVFSTYPIMVFAPEQSARRWDSSTYNHGNLNLWIVVKHSHHTRSNRCHSTFPGCRFFANQTPFQHYCLVKTGHSVSLSCNLIAM